MLGLVLIELLLTPIDNFLSSGDREVLILDRLGRDEILVLVGADGSVWSFESNMSSKTSSLISMMGPKISSPFSSRSMSLTPLSSWPPSLIGEKCSLMELTPPAPVNTQLLLASGFLGDLSSDEELNILVF